MRYLINLWKQLTAFVAAEVPAEVAACEFDCHELDCQEHQWANCSKRMQKSQAIAAMSKSTSHE